MPSIVQRFAMRARVCVRVYARVCTGLLVCNVYTHVVETHVVETHKYGVKINGFLTSLCCICLGPLPLARVAKEKHQTNLDVEKLLARGQCHTLTPKNLANHCQIETHDSLTTVPSDVRIPLVLSRFHLISLSRCYLNRFPCFYYYYYLTCLSHLFFHDTSIPT